MDINFPIADISPYCKRLSKPLARLGLKKVKDLLLYYPARYEDLCKIKKIIELIPGVTGTLKARIVSIKNFRSSYKSKKITEAMIEDETGKAKVIWFNQWFLTNIIKPNDEIFFALKGGEIKTAREIISPEYEIAKQELVHSGRIVPIYPLTYGITQKQIRTAIVSAMKFLDGLEETFDKKINKAENLMPLLNAISEVHFPSNMALAQKARDRLALEELLIMQLKNCLARKEFFAKKSSAINFFEKETKIFVSSLPFCLTNAQRKAAWQILQDMGKDHPMNRLLNGDVGSGKTVVSAIAIHNCALSKFQSAFLAPTEILAKQHNATFCKWFANSKINIALCTRESAVLNGEKQKKSELIKKIENGVADLIIGTHALLQEKITFKKLGLTVIDEQHRFGVEQRLSITKANKNVYPHLLSMTATPIPRTLSLVLYGDLDISLLDEMPKNRKSIKTIVSVPQKSRAMYEFIKKEIALGRQAFIICPLILESDKLGAKSVETEYKRLKFGIFKDVKIGMLHGKMTGEEKDETMKKFKENDIKILIATSVVEVGIDVPNASIMLIEGAERFGLAQLHQFRGRVGRGEHQSYCIIAPTDSPTSKLKSLERLNEGYKVAELDLSIRGQGNIFGKEQSGRIEFKLQAMNNPHLIAKAKQLAQDIIKTLDFTKYPGAEKYIQEIKNSVHWE